jgi:hypothetical protein
MRNARKAEVLRTEEEYKSIDRLLSLPPASAPADYHHWEEEYARRKQPCRPNKLRTAAGRAA